MLYNTENIVLRSLQILHIFVLREEKVTILATVSAQRSLLYKLSIGFLFLQQRIV